MRAVNGEEKCICSTNFVPNSLAQAITQVIVFVPCTFVLRDCRWAKKSLSNGCNALAALASLVSNSVILMMILTLGVTGQLCLPSSHRLYVWEELKDGSSCPLRMIIPLHVRSCSMFELSCREK